jgi:two-component system response regulator HydG
LTVQPDPRDVEIAALHTEVDRLRQEMGRKYHFDNLIGRSAAMKQVYALMEKAIDSGLMVLISGETGTGKELVAKAIHYNSLRKNKPLLALNCGAVPKDLVASILFGHRKGAFTGAYKDSSGLFESAFGGTVLLDEVSEMPNEAQVHLLRALQERQIQRVGETTLRDIDVRIIAITNKDLEAEVKAGRFREDLYYRLNAFPIHLPPLRDRLDDIPLLAEYFLQKACQQLKKKIEGFAEGVFEMLQSYSWPGNVRELENEINRAAALMEEGLKIRNYHFSSKITKGESLIQVILSESLSYSEAVDRFRRRLIENALRECGGNRTKAAQMLGMDRSNLIKQIKNLEISV